MARGAVASNFVADIRRVDAVLGIEKASAGLEKESTVSKKNTHIEATPSTRCFVVLLLS